MGIGKVWRLPLFYYICLDPSCSTKKYDNMELMGHTTIGYHDKSFEDCLTLCCENRMCKSFDHGDHSGYNCAIISTTKDEVSLVPGSKQWSHYEVFKTSGMIVGEGKGEGKGGRAYCLDWTQNTRYTDIL